MDERMNNEALPNKKNMALVARDEEPSSSSSRRQDDEDNHLSREELAMFTKFRKFLKNDFKKKSSRHKPTRRTCYECGKYGHFIAHCPNKKDKSSDEDGHKKEKTHKKFKHFKKDKTYKKHKHHAHVCQEWDSNEESSSSSKSESEEDEVAAIATTSLTFTKKSLFGNLSDDDDSPLCLMAKGQNGLQGL